MTSSFSTEVYTSIVNIGTDSYLLGAGLPTDIEISSSGSLEPVTIISVTDDDDAITPSWLNSKYEEFSELDDVWCHAFARNVFAQKKPGVLSLAAGSGTPQAQRHKTSRYQGGPLTTGPYILSGSKIHRVYKLYQDPLSAFVCGVIPTSLGSNRYQRIPTNYIPVPSRLYSPLPSDLQPLSGKRIAVKDIFDLEGVKTTVCSKAYEALQDLAKKTAPSIQKLIDQGAVIIGKVKTTPFSSGVGPRDWVDYQAPFNPRGCGYLDANCSSAGSGAALAGYEWLDFTIGSDTLGSMVGPAADNGLFGIRPTHGRISCEGVVPVSSYLDTPGIFSRDITEFSAATKSWFGSSNLQAFLAMPTKLTSLSERYADFSPEVKGVMEHFIQDFEKATQLHRTTTTMEKLWASHAPVSSSGKNLLETFGSTLAHIQLYDHYNNTISFREDYRKKFNTEPYAEPLLRYKWSLGAKITHEQYTRALKEKEIFATFIKDHIFSNGGVMLLPFGFPDVFYRDEYSGSVEEYGPQWQGFNLFIAAFSALGGGPAVSIPVGQRLYDSKVTGVKEYQPVGLMLLGAPGTDEYLIELVKHVLVTSGRPLSVKTGKVAF
ncbi:51fdc51b-cd06-49dc-9505-fb824c6327b2 [Sclerotinia trifoliorum]|uniref:51fdc51b-cd06-49dc-9505-fb824c6327b2 n=1 Tax=Sclerotinia trifoliorum TaxID=28548 RepID=A0A8H2ZNJ7_9HELO|nr:51fdc51b-cd06-49dc-9505-fb824c6327b2 [Sclerotinia trifoliorum]